MASYAKIFGLSADQSRLLAIVTDDGESTAVIGRDESAIRALRAAAKDVQGNDARNRLRSIVHTMYAYNIDGPLEQTGSATRAAVVLEQRYFT